MAETEINYILEYLQEQRGFDWSGYCPSLLERRIQSRRSATNTRSCCEYIQLLKSNPSELDQLLDTLTIKVSAFFRDPLPFDYLREKILPRIIARKVGSSFPSLRIWSAGCAAGEDLGDAGRRGLGEGIHVFLYSYLRDGHRSKCPDPGAGSKLFPR
ncbi:MAG: hypothetical protein HQK55_10760 [Deltaproteobacteria bacterium]|nr:hypothetical protein [Deltaproteobacteria bacterium]